LSSLGWSQCDGCNYLYLTDIYDVDVYGYYQCDSTITNVSYCNEGDIIFLIDLINQNEIDEETSNTDVDNGDGIFEPIELGQQIWENGRLIRLILWGSTYGVYFNYNISIIPESISNLDNIIHLDLDNNLIESLPSSFSDLQSLEYLWFSNPITEIPVSIWNLNNLKLLGIWGTNISIIPSEIWNLTNLTHLYLYGNQLTGEIPESVGQLTNLRKLYLYDNQLTGEIPSEIGNLTNLTSLNLSSNQLTGEIPESICDIDNVYIGLGNNQLCPPYPECLSPHNVSDQVLYNCNDVTFECKDGYVENKYFCYYRSDLEVL